MVLLGSFELQFMASRSSFTTTASKSVVLRNVGDVVRSVVALMNTEHAPGEIFNIGSDQPISILELAKEVIRLTGIEERNRLPKLPRCLRRRFRRYPSAHFPTSAKLEKFIGFKPGTSLKQTIEEIAKSMS